MQHSFLVLIDTADDTGQGIHQAEAGVSLCHKLLQLLAQGFIHSPGNILKMIIKGVAVDAAMFHDVLYGNLL